MRKWLVEETGDFRHVNPYEWYMSAGRDFNQWTLDYTTAAMYPILMVTEIAKQSGSKSPTDKFDEWNW